MIEILIELLERFAISEGADLEGLKYANKKFQQGKAILKNPNQALRNLLKSQLGKSNTVEEIRKVYKNKNVRQKVEKELNNYLQEFINLPNVKAQFKQFLLDKMIDDPNYKKFDTKTNKVYDDVPIQTFISLVST